VPPTIWTIGYERLRLEELVTELQAAGVRRLLDVRYRPQSRRAGFSKTRLGATLREAGISYENRRTLGTPPDIRWLYRNRQPDEGARQYRIHLEETAAEELDALALELRDGPPTALLCFEEEPAECHRREITEALKGRRPELLVVDL
jgi:uncharacterized protein (DUF488 family)